jgi:periplasmic protein TonB
VSVVAGEGGIQMFRESLLESSLAKGNRTRWPMATAFTLEMIFASVLVMLPLITTGVLPLSTHVLPPMPPRYTPLEATQPAPAQGSIHSDAPTLSRREVVALNPHPRLPYSRLGPADRVDPDAQPQFHFDNNGPALPDPDIHGRAVRPAEPVKPVRISEPSPAMLTNRVIPVYPIPAQRAGIEGEVKLHAIIARDGSIQSLNVTSGHPLLIGAALEAVRQWKYRPYLLNGEAVEVETYITVSFKRGS